ncbi:hypothetical protein DBR32_15540 [Taibaiella sp. KBW10]|uniref:aKG-HExxH-type peptide beta-hydroxylase n=1 Tax=Taibaiella sp. KBW10 TaxID=2153357 RepID=UPI000F598017|nr:HEXXH motif-containing putative peptide modification protein [Taibaiella sp. KBW10]RQO29670.1 hypothetical protein DBR32_15540 [Taibaiella sp. KBW10]
MHRNIRSTTLHAWLPAPLQSEQENLALQQWICDAVSKRISNIDIAFTSKVHALLERTRTSNCHPAIFQWYNGVKAANNQEIDWPVFIERWEHALEAASASQSRAKELQSQYDVVIDIAPAQDAMMPTIKKAILMAKKANGTDCEIEVLTDLEEDLQFIIREGIKIIQNFWPEMLAEIKVTLKQLFIFKSEKVIGFVDFGSHGSIWLRESAIRTPLQFAEELIHECSHMRLNAMHALNPLFSNPDSELFTSPLRPDRRPMFGVFHQMFVLLRLKKFFTNVHTLPRNGYDLSLKNNITIDSKLDKIQQNLTVGFDVVQNHAQLTTSGHIFMEELTANNIVA